MIQKLHVAAVAGMMVISASGSPQTSSPSIPVNFPLNLWSEHKKVTQIPWEFSFGKPRLREDFRQELPLQAEIREADLEKIGNSSDLTIFMRVLDGNRPITGIHSGAPSELVARISAGSQTQPSGTVSVQPAPEYKNIGITWLKIAIARPGKYRLELALLDRSSGRHSTLYEDLSIPGSESDPLEKALSGLPRFEFGESTPAPFIRNPTTTPGTSVLDRALAEIGAITKSLSPPVVRTDVGVSKQPLPQIPVDRAGKLHLSVLTILSPPDATLDNEHYLAAFRENLTLFLSAFLRLDVLHGSAKLSAADLINRRLVFDMQNMKELPLERIEAEIRKDTNTVSFDALAGAGERGRFLRDVLRAKLEAAENDAEGAQHVIIIVAPRTEIPGISSLQPLIPGRDCHCQVVYLRVAPKSGADDIDDLLKWYRPQVFEPVTWLEFRKDFGTIYQQLIR
jgi:hypothetical protein